MKKKVFIRADGSARIGLGHIMRCISLAHMLRDDFSIHFFAIEIPDSLKNEILQNGWNITEIAKESDFSNVLTGNEIVVLDGYQFDSDYQKEIKKKGSKLVCIDDFHDQYFYADIVINHAPGLTEDEYQSESYTKYLLGPEYALLRPEFLNGHPDEKKRNIETVKNIFVCFGGSDAKNLTTKVLSWIPSNGHSVTTVLGNTFSHQEELKKVVDERQDLEIIVKNSLSAKEMKLELERADLAIVPASGILFEVISTGLPAISGYYIDNQQGIYNGFKRLGCIIDAKNFDKENFFQAMQTVNNKSLALIRKNQTQAIDGLSMDRIQVEFKNLPSICV